MASVLQWQRQMFAHNSAMVCSFGGNLVPNLRGKPLKQRQIGPF